MRSLVKYTGLLISLTILTSCSESNGKDDSSLNQTDPNSEICDCYSKNITDYQNTYKYYESSILEDMDDIGTISPKGHIDFLIKIKNEDFNHFDTIYLKAEDFRKEIQFDDLIACVKQTAQSNEKIKEYIELLDFIVVSPEGSLNDFNENADKAIERLAQVPSQKWLKPFLLNGILNFYEIYYSIRKSNEFKNSTISEEEFAPPPPPPAMPPPPVEEPEEEETEEDYEEAIIEIDGY